VRTCKFVQSLVAHLFQYMIVTNKFLFKIWF